MLDEERRRFCAEVRDRALADGLRQVLAGEQAGGEDLPGGNQRTVLAVHVGLRHVLRRARGVVGHDVEVLALGAQAFQHGGRAGQNARGVLQHAEGVEEDHRVTLGEFGEIHRVG